MVIVPLLLAQQWWLSLLAVFIGLRSWGGLHQARLLAQLETSPRHIGLACPFCAEAPPTGQVARCGHCGTESDLFASGGTCPECKVTANELVCPHCFRSNPLTAWYPAVIARAEDSGLR